MLYTIIKIYNHILRCTHIRTFVKPTDSILDGCDKSLPSPSQYCPTTQKLYTLPCLSWNKPTWKEELLQSAKTNLVGFIVTTTVWDPWDVSRHVSRPTSKNTETKCFGPLQMLWLAVTFSLGSMLCNGQQVYTVNHTLKFRTTTHQKPWVTGIGHVPAVGG